MNQYTEHEKLEKVKDQSQTCGEFLEWLQGEYTLCNYQSHMETHPLFTPAKIDAEKILAAFFGIDTKKLEQEKRAMLDEIRSTINDYSKR